MGAKTVKRLAILLTTILVAGLSIFFIQRYQVEKMDRSVLAQAARAEKDGNFEEAARFYQEHLEVAPDDQEAKLKYADVLRKGPKNPARQEQAAQLYDQYVARFPANNSARRRLAELNVETGRYDKARPHLEILLKSESDDGALCFLLGRCQEANEPAQAVKSFEHAIEYDAPQRPEADSRLAALLVRLDRRNDAKNVIEKMVKDDPKNYRVYLERGSYLRRFGQTQDRKSAKDDLQRALEMAPNDPKVYAELAALARLAKNDDEARRVIEEGLKVLPNDPTLHLERAMLEMSGSSGSIDKAITSLRHSVDLLPLPDQPLLRLNLARLLARRGDTSELLTQIGELKRVNLSPIEIGLLEAMYLMNCTEWKKAILSLVKLQQLGEQSEESKAQVQDLLAQCYHHLGDRDRERDAYQRSIRANPKDVQARLALATSLVARGEIDPAIKEYQLLLDQLQERQREAELLTIRGRLVELLIARNQQRAVAQRDWNEVEKLINTVKESAPQSSGWVILQTELLAAQDNIAEAQVRLNEARSRTPRDVELWVKSAEMLRRQRKFDDARKLLDQAQKLLGDSVALRIERSQLLALQGGADLPKTLGALAEKADSFSGAERRRLLEVLAQEADRLDDRTLVTDLWSQVAKLAPNDLEPQLRLLELALQGRSKADVENRLNEIKRIEGADGSNGKFGEARYTIWQAANTTDPSEQAKLRSTAQSLLKDLMSRRQDWPRATRMLADLTLADQFQPNLSDDQKKRGQVEAAKLYLQAIELGQRDLDTIRRATDLVYATKDDEVVQLWTQLFTNTTAGSDLLRQGSFEALRKRDNEQALKLAQKAKEANPDDFRASLLLVRMLIANQRQVEAEKELRAAVNANPSDPDRWFVLLQFLTLTKQLEKAETAVHDAESVIKDKPLRLAQCCDVLGQGYKTAGQDQESKTWNNLATRWYRAARNAQPKDLIVIRQFIDFLLRSGQLEEVEDRLKAILDNKDPGNDEERAWARRTLALTLAASKVAEKRREALSLLEPSDQATVAQQKGDRLPKPEDLRVLVRVYEAQGTPAYHKKARDVLEGMDRTDVADPEDRFNLALKYSNDGDWGKAQEQYRKLLAQTENSIDLEVFKRRPDYIAQFIEELLKQYQRYQSQEVLSEAQDLIEKYKALRPNAFNGVALEARLYKAQNHIDKAIKLIQATANRPDLSDPDPVWQLLATLADQLGETKLAETLLRQLVEKSDRPQNRLALAKFLGRHGRVKEAIDLCEQRWNATTNPEELVVGTMEVLSSSNPDSDKTQFERVAGWMEKWLEKQPKSLRLAIALAGLRERQGRFQEAETLYAQCVEKRPDNAIVLNNLAWLMALRNDDENVALGYINSAIKLGGEVPELLDTRGVVYTKLRRSQDAITDLIKATKLDPSGPKYFHLAQAYLQAGDTPAAAESWAKARSKGLTPDGLHALEVPGYQQFLKDLGTR